MTTQLELFDIVTDAKRGGGMLLPSWRGLRAWLIEIDRQLGLMRPSSAHYGRFDGTARQLTTERIRASCDHPAVRELTQRLSAARFPCSHHLHDLNRVWDRAELGPLVVEATNRDRLLAMGRSAPRPKGPRLDPSRIPEDRLDVLIQTHRDLGLVDALRTEKRRRVEARRLGGEGREDAGERV